MISDSDLRDPRFSRRDFLHFAGRSAAVGIAALTGAEGLLAQAREKAQPLNLKITDVKTWIVFHSADRNYVYCKIYTNQGIIGCGEGSITSKGATVSEAILEHKRYLVGKDPTDIEIHWQAMYRWPRWRGGPILNTAISAVEMALWDILGQSLGQPVYRLLGGKARERLRMYVHPRGGDGLSPEGYAQAWIDAKNEGWTAGKSNFLTIDNNIVDPVRSVSGGIANLKAVREAIGPDFSILIDVHGRATPPMAHSFCRQAEQYNPFFIEEGTQIEDIGELELLRSKTRIPLATGERLFTKYGFSEICSRHLVDYVQPDVVHCGGILEMKKIAAIAEAYRIEFAPHNPQSELATMASLHVDMTAPNFAIQEVSSERQQSFWGDFFYGQGAVFEDGYALPPDRPGLGVNFDEALAETRPYQPITRMKLHFPDGGIADH